MGLVGCFLAQELSRASIPFTWSDLDVARNEAGATGLPRSYAWRASTGCIYPSDEPDERAAYNEWHRWKRFDWALPFVEEGRWWFNTKKPPHLKKKAAVIEGPAPLRQLKDETSLHWNSQRFVAATRAKFADRVILQADIQPSNTVVSHGFGPRLDHVVWGWSGLADLTPGRPEAEELFKGPTRPAFYSREGRFIWGYAYPCPGTPFWYVGSSMIAQKVPKNLATAEKFTKWCSTFRRLTGGNVAIRSAYNIEEGWRPYPAASDTALVTRREDRAGGALHVRPMGASGVRLAPLLVRAVFKELGL